MYVTLGLLKAGSGGGGSGGGGGGGGGGGSGTFPSIVSYTYDVEAGGSFSVLMPATVVVNDLLIILLNKVSAGSLLTSVASGWTDFFAGSANAHKAFYKWADGTEDGDEVEFSPTGPSSTYVITTLRVQGADPAQNPQASWGSEVSTATPNPPEVDPTWADANNLFIAWAGTTGVRTIVSYPAGYTLYQEEYDDTLASLGTIFVAAKQSTSSALENPGVFTVSSSAATKVATIAVKGAP